MRHRSVPKYPRSARPAEKIPQPGRVRPAAGRPGPARRGEWAPGSASGRRRPAARRPSAQAGSPRRRHVRPSAWPDRTRNLRACLPPAQTRLPSAPRRYRESSTVRSPLHKPGRPAQTTLPESARGSTWNPELPRLAYRPLRGRVRALALAQVPEWARMPAVAWVRVLVREPAPVPVPDRASRLALAQSSCQWVSVAVRAQVRAQVPVPGSVRAQVPGPARAQVPGPAQGSVRGLVPGSALVLAQALAQALAQVLAQSSCQWVSVAVRAQARARSAGPRVAGAGGAWLRAQP